MRHKISKFFCFILCIVCVTLSASAAKEILTVQFYDVNNAKYVSRQVTTVDLVCDGEVLTPDVPALIDRGRTLVPIYIIGDLLNAQVEWNQEFRRAQITTADKSLILTIGSSLARVNGQEVELPDGIPAALVKYNGADRTMVPWRFVAEQLGATVEWDPDTYTVTMFFEREAEPESLPENDEKPQEDAENEMNQDIDEPVEEEPEPPLIPPFTSLEELVVVLDAGHGGSDPGAINEFVEEKEINLAVTLMVSDRLEEAGVQVYLTREDDSHVSLSERTTFANELLANIFVSMHSNAAEDAPSAHGIETYYYSDDREGAILASCVQKNVIETTEAKNRKTKTANFYVCKNTLMPAVLVEMGFLTNANESLLMVTEEYQQLIADGIAEGILDYAESIIEKNGAIKSLRFFTCLKGGRLLETRG
ncbi:MAG: hypothetical protein E7471_00115 [Ruminococcaceae bacterium]|nr:hypothetical protein [Oscillospiraceae bacterium]